MTLGLSTKPPLLSAADPFLAKSHLAETPTRASSRLPMAGLHSPDLSSYGAGLQRFLLELGSGWLLGAWSSRQGFIQDLEEQVGGVAVSVIATPASRSILGEFKNLAKLGQPL